MNTRAKWQKSAILALHIIHRSLISVFLSRFFFSRARLAGISLRPNVGHHKCREQWPEGSKNYERAFTFYLDGILLVVPLIMLAATYSLITKSLWQGMRAEKQHKNQLSFDSTRSCMYILTSPPHNHKLILYRCMRFYHTFLLHVVYCANVRCIISFGYSVSQCEAHF